MDEPRRRGRPRSTTQLMSVREGTFDRALDRDEAIKMVERMSHDVWTYKLFAEVYGKSKVEAVELMNDLVHYGLMVYIGRPGAGLPQFKRCPYVPEKW